MQTSFQTLAYRSRAACHHALHDNHEEDKAHVLLAISTCLIIGFGDIGAYHFVQLSLK